MKINGISSYELTFFTSVLECLARDVQNRRRRAAVLDIKLTCVSSVKRLRITATVATKASLETVARQIKMYALNCVPKATQNK